MYAVKTLFPNYFLLFLNQVYWLLQFFLNKVLKKLAGDPSANSAPAPCSSSPPGFTPTPSPQTPLKEPTPPPTPVLNQARIASVFY